MSQAPAVNRSALKALLREPDDCIASKDYTHHHHHRPIMSQQVSPTECLWLNFKDDFINIAGIVDGVALGIDILGNI